MLSTIFTFPTPEELVQIDGDILTVPEVARYLKTGESTIYKLAQTGQLRHLRFGRSIRIRRCDLQTYITEHLNIR